jgi:hypothetical protein
MRFNIFSVGGANYNDPRFIPTIITYHHKMKFPKTLFRYINDGNSGGLIPITYRPGDIEYKREYESIFPETLRNTGAKNITVFDDRLEYDIEYTEQFIELNTLEDIKNLLEDYPAITFSKFNDSITIEICDNIYDEDGE